MKKIFILFLTLFSFSVLALSVPPLTRPVEDLAGILSNTEKQNIEALIRDIHERKLGQISVLIIPSLEGEVLENYSIKVAEKWQLGTAQEDNGLLLLLAMKERKIRIEVGNGIEGVITDAHSRRMIEGMGNHMRSQNYEKAILSVVKSVEERFLQNTPEYKEKEKELALQREKKREEDLAKIHSFLFIVFNTFMVMFGISLLIKYFSLKKETATIKKENEKLEEYSQTCMKANEKLKSQLSSLKIDTVKQGRINFVHFTAQLKAQKESLQYKLEQMKKKVG